MQNSWFVLKDKEINQRLGILADTIHKYCEDKGISRVFGEEHLITRSLVSSMDYDENKLRGILEPARLWNMVLRYDPKLTKELLKDPSIKQEIKKQINELEKVVKSYHQLRYKRKSERDYLDKDVS